jgi:hypothetical protein
MIVFGFIRIHLKGCIGMIIFKGLKFLLIVYILNRGILVQMKLDIHV